MTRAIGALWRGRKVLLLVAPVAVVVVWLGQPRLQPTDRELLEALVNEVEEGFDSQDAAKVMDRVAPDYQDSAGLDRDDVLAIVGRLARQAQSVEITIHDASIDVAPPKATGRFDVVAVVDTGGDVIRWPMKLEVEFEKRKQGALKLWRRAWVVTSCDGHGLTEDWEQSF
jgi:hypothetical protein